MTTEPVIDPVAAELAVICGLVTARDGLIARMKLATVTLPEFNAAQDRLAKHLPRLLALAEAVRGLTRDSDGSYLPPGYYVPVGEFQNAIADALTGPEGFVPPVIDSEPLDYLKTWAEFWQPVICREDGSVNFGQLARELADYSDLTGHAGEVYQHVTNGAIGKVNTRPSAVIEVADEVRRAAAGEAVAEAIDSLIADFEDEQSGHLTPTEVVALIRRWTGRQATGGDEPGGS